MNLPTRHLLTLLAAAPLALAACGGSDDDAEASPARTIEISATEYSFSGDPGEQIVAGETIQFVLTNEGQLIHELQVWTEDAKVLGFTGEVPPGGRDAVTIEFDEPGTYQVVCDVDDHRSRGQVAQFVVAEP